MEYPFYFTASVCCWTFLLSLICFLCLSSASSWAWLSEGGCVWSSLIFWDTELIIFWCRTLPIVSHGCSDLPWSGLLNRSSGDWGDNKMEIKQLNWTQWMALKTNLNPQYLVFVFLGSNEKNNIFHFTVNTMTCVTLSKFWYIIGWLTFRLILIKL